MNVRRAIVLVSALAASLAAIVAFDQLQRTASWAEESAMLALEQEVRTQIDLFRRAHGAHPASLHDLELDYRRTDGANDRMLECFSYEPSPSSYTLTRKPCPARFKWYSIPRLGW